MRQLLLLLLLPALLIGCDAKKTSDAATADSKPVDTSVIDTAAVDTELGTNDSAAMKSAAAIVNTFTNPIFPNSADPWLEYFDGNYYLTTTTWTSQLVMRKSPTLGGLATATPINIWSESDLGRCCNFWAFEFHRLKTEKGHRWYVMYTSGVAENLDRQHLSVVESQGDDPMGPYTYKGSPMPEIWNIDGNYLEHNGQLYLLWSQWVGDEQTIWISKMSNPWTVEGERVLIVRPQYEWEFSGRKVNEGPEILKRNGKTFMVYSASYCNTPDYKLGLIELVGDDPLQVDAWHKFDKPVFSRGNGVFGPGHNGFFKSPDGTEDWLIYHGNASELEGCSSTRSVRAQKFTWNADDTPNFGEPVSAGVPVESPAGENGPLVTKVQGTKVQLVSKATEQCVALDASGKVVESACDAAQSQWTLDYTTQGNYRLVSDSGLFFGEGNQQCVNTTAGELNASPWHNQQCQQWQLTSYHQGWLTIVNAQSNKELSFADCKEPDLAAGKKTVDDIPLLIEKKLSCVQWRIQPVADIALTSVQSGKAVTPAGDVKAGSVIEQVEWKDKDSQQWNFVHVENGYYSVQSKANPKLCLSVVRKSIVPGAGIELAECGEVHAQWQVDFLKDGTTRLANRKSTLPLDLANCGVADHTPFAQGHWYDTPCQKFQLKPIN